MFLEPRTKHLKRGKFPFRERIAGGFVRGSEPDTEVSIVLISQSNLNLITGQTMPPATGYWYWYFTNPGFRAR